MVPRSRMKRARRGRMTFDYKRLAAASAVALIAGLLAGLAASAATMVGELNGGWDWGDFGRLLLVFAAYNFVLGLLPGLAAHIVLVRLKLTGIAPYLGVAALIGIIWCIVIPFAIAGQAYVLTSALVGTASFWLVRRPDHSSEVSAAPARSQPA